MFQDEHHLLILSQGSWSCAIILNHQGSEEVHRGRCVAGGLWLFLFHLCHLVIEQGSDNRGVWLHLHLDLWIGLHLSVLARCFDICIEHCGRGKTVQQGLERRGSLTVGAVFFLFYLCDPIHNIYIYIFMYIYVYIHVHTHMFVT